MANNFNNEVGVRWDQATYAKPNLSVYRRICLRDIRFTPYNLDCDFAVCVRTKAGFYAIGADDCKAQGFGMLTLQIWHQTSAITMSPATVFPETMSLTTHKILSNCYTSLAAVVNQHLSTEAVPKARETLAPLLPAGVMEIVIDYMFLTPETCVRGAGKCPGIRRCECTNNF
jgi:hypothetical protein